MPDQRQPRDPADQSHSLRSAPTPTAQSGSAGFHETHASSGYSSPSPAPTGATSKRVTWAELFFDLVFVFSITQVSALLDPGSPALGAIRALVVFVPVYWTWVGATMHGNLHDTDSAGMRIGLFAVALFGLFLALAVPGSFGSLGLMFGASYWAARVVLYLLMRGTYRAIGWFHPFTAAAFVTGPLLVLGGLVPDPQRLLLWAVAALIDLSMPYLARKGLARIPFQPAHLAERYGLFIIIALGESVVAIGVAAEHGPLAAEDLLAVSIGFMVTAALWWVYFAFAASAIRAALSNADTPLEAIRPVLPYGHLGFLAGIIALSAGVGEVVVSPSDPLDGGAVALLMGGTALFLATFGYTRWQLFHTISTPRLLAAMACVVLVPPALLLPAIVTLTLLLVVLVALNAIEAWLVRRPRPAGGRPLGSRKS